MRLTLNWLNNKLINQDNGIIFDCHDSNSFYVIQDFIEACDRQFTTPAIYYQAFPEESAVDFLNILGAELASKLGKPELSSQQSLLNIIEQAELKIIVIDDCHLHPQDTLQDLLDFFAVCKVAVILVGCRHKMAIAQVLHNSTVVHWDTLEVTEEWQTTAKFR
jgi:hypothetical protein